MPKNANAKPKKLTAKTLKDQLFETLQGVRAGSIQPAHADAIASQAREIVRTANLQVSIIGKAGKKITKELVDFAVE